MPSETDWARLKDEEGLLNDALLDFHLDRLAVLSSVAGGNWIQIGKSDVVKYVP